MRSVDEAGGEVCSVRSFRWAGSLVVLLVGTFPTVALEEPVPVPLAGWSPTGLPTGLPTGRTSTARRGGMRSGIPSGGINTGGVNTGGVNIFA